MIPHHMQAHHWEHNRNIYHEMLQSWSTDPWPPERPITYRWTDKGYTFA